MKTKVIIKKDYYQGIFKKGDNGYIDGYVRGGDNVPLAVVVVHNRIDLVPLHNLIVITD